MMFITEIDYPAEIANRPERGNLGILRIRAQDHWSSGRFPANSDQSSAGRPGDEIFLLAMGSFPLADAQKAATVSAAQKLIQAIDNQAQTQFK
jgi:hypothetical protein